MLALKYHDATKHHFNRFARSLGYLDWATQPDPFRRYAGAPLVALDRLVVAGGVAYEALFDRSVSPAPVDERTIGEFLRCSMGLSAWKQYQSSRWPLRVNPSSGNLHPTECYIVRSGQVCHYAPREHALEVRCEFESRSDDVDGSFLVGLTSITWREAWKYGERAFRYCQHDVGHAIAAFRFAAALLGWRMTLLPNWPDDAIASLLGIDRADDYGEAEREEPECIAVVSATDPDDWLQRDPDALRGAVARGSWHGRANRLSSSHVEWEVIDRVAEATRYQGSGIRDQGSGGREATGDEEHGSAIADPKSRRARSVILQRRSAVAFDARSTLGGDAFIAMLRRLAPDRPPWDAIGWPPHVHLALFVHRVDGLEPGLYAYVRDRAVVDEWRAAMRSEFLWEPVRTPDGDATCLFLLLPTDVKWAGMRVSCDQDIAGDGFFSLGMIARLEEPLRVRGDWFYRRLFWECGMIGQVLYLEAEAAGARATGIGCFYDDAVHDVLGLSGHAWQSLYHFSMGMPVDDPRLTTESGYDGAW